MFFFSKKLTNAYVSEKLNDFFQTVQPMINELETFSEMGREIYDQCRKEEVEGWLRDSKYFDALYNKINNFVKELEKSVEGAKSAESSFAISMALKNVLTVCSDYNSTKIAVAALKLV